MSDPFANLPVAKKRKGIFSDVSSGSSSGESDPFASLPAKKKKKGSIVQSLAETATFGFGDEAAGAIGAVLGGDYKTSKEDYQTRRQNYKDENPKKALGAEIAGGIATALPTMGRSLVAPGASILRKTGIGAAEGAILGGAAGAGSTDGGLRERSRGALIGAGAGGAIGATLPIVGGVARGIRGAIAPATKRTAESQANRLLRTALERDGVAPSDMASRAASMDGKSPILPDVAGRNTLGLARAAQATPGRAKEELASALDERASGQLGRIAGDVESALGMERQNIHDVAENLIAKRKANAAPLYDAARPQPISDPELQKEIRELLQLPEFKSAMARGLRIANVERNPLKKGESLTVGHIDYMKRGLDALIDSRAGSKNAISRTEARALRTRLDELLSMVDDRHPEYAEARHTFKGDSEMIESLESGRKFLADDARLTSKALKAMSEGEREMFKVGALDAIRSAMDKAGDNADLVKRVFGSTHRREQLRALLGDEEFEVLANKMGAEAQLVRTRDGILGGPATARIGAELADMAGANIGEMASTGIDVARGNVPALLMRGAAALGRRAQGNVGNVADNLSGKMLLQPGTPQFDDLMRLLAEESVKSGRGQARGNVARRALAGTVGGSTGGGR